ncbi:MAG: chloride channel protein [Oceanicoccus sp.]
MQNNWIRNTRHRLADANSLLPLSVLGVVSGFSCALVILLFRYLIDTPSAFWLPDHDSENFEALPQWLHFALPVAGAIIIGFFLSRMKPEDSRTGIVHVITRLHLDNGHLPLKNALVQFFGGAFAIATGQSGGREGPAIHLGAAANSLLGQKLMLPNNSIRLLVGCGIAAAIAASFNTPIAGVIFAMEVVMMEYTVGGFIPVMLASITGTAMTRAVYGSEMIFSIPPISMASLWEMPFIAFLGLVVGCCAALFMVILKAALRYIDKPIFPRLVLAGVITGCCALLVPEVMGIGYDSLNGALANELSLTLLLVLIIAKIIATATSSGLGMPIGLIGPNLLIGACIGSAMGDLGANLFPDLASNHSFYVLLGMGAMMGAVLNAPLAALMALLEFSNDTSMIFPGMLAITIATLTNSELFNQKSAHQTVFQHIKLLLPTDPMSLALQRTSVSSIMHRSLCTTPSQVTTDEAKLLIEKDVRWYAVMDEANKPTNLVAGLDMIVHIEKYIDSNTIYLLDDSITIQPLAELNIQATLKEALNKMDDHKVNALFVSGYRSGTNPDNGIVTRDDIEQYYKTPQSY